MNDKTLHIDSSELLSFDFFNKGKFTWEKPKEEIWENLFSKVLIHKPVKIFSMKRLISYGIAATIALLVGIGSFVWFWQTTIRCPAGQHLSAQLPDGSTIEMNAESSLKYFPYRWTFSRDVIFEGEGFFMVEKGKRFKVHSKFGETSVLGTSFNIYSRNDFYRVSCLTGKVRVTASNKESVILNPNQQVILKPGGELKKMEVEKADDLLSWRNNRFLFTATPFFNVAKEIERQYGISIRTEGNVNGIFTGNFDKISDVEEVLNLVCKPLGYKFVRQSERIYIILPQN
jgi:transmembrane sensor